MTPTPEELNATRIALLCYEAATERGPEATVAHNAKLIASAIREAVDAEREAAANVAQHGDWGRCLCDTDDGKPCVRDTAVRIAAALRARKGTESSK